MKASKVTLNLAWLALVAALALGWLSDHIAQQRSGFLLPIEAQETLYRDDGQEICLTTHRKPGLLGRQIFQVWERQTDDKPWQPLLTLEPAQDTPIGPPILRQTSGGIVVTDEKRNFEFDPASKELRKNDWPDAIYSGPVRCCLAPQ